MNTTQTNKHTCSHPLAPAQAVFEAAMRDKVIALKSMLEHMVSSSDVGLVSHAEDKVRALNATIQQRLTELEAFVHEQLLLVSTSLAEDGGEVDTQIAQIASDRRKMLIDLLAQVHEDKVSLAAVHNDTLATQEEQEATVARVSAHLQNLVDVVIFNSTESAGSASSDWDKIIANLSQTLSAASERQNTESGDMVEAYSSWFEQWAQRALDQVSAVKDQLAARDAHVATETSDGQENLEAIGSGIEDALAQVSVRMQGAQDAGIDASTDANATFEEAAADSTAHADEEMTAAHVRLEDLHDDDLEEYITGHLKSLREAVDSVLRQLNATVNASARNATEVEDDADAALHSNGEDVANLTSFYASSDQQLLADITALDHAIASFHERLGRLRAFGPGATEAYNASAQWVALAETLAADSEAFEGLVHEHKESLQEMVDGFSLVRSCVCVLRVPCAYAVDSNKHTYG